jgi:prepilin-type N-terminal cleavage/methylation domain-containing protein
MGADGAFPSQAVRNNTLSHGTGADGAFPSQASDPAHKNDAGKSGFTLIELLVVISIMAALTALMLPRLRTVNQDRGIREAARVVGSKFAEASDRARRDGKASVTLFRNPNMVDVNGVQFGVSTISISRAVPNFIGDDDTLATVTSTFGGGRALLIPLPLEYDQSTPEENVVRAGDFVRFNQAGSPPMPVTVTSSVAYQITNVSPLPSGGSLQLVLDRKPTQPPLPSAGTSVSYVIERQPKLLRSSITDLPPGYTVDLRLSGPVVPMEDGSGEVSVLSTHEVRPVFFEVMRPGLEADQTSTAERARLAAQYSRIDVLFDSTGGVSSVRTYRGNWNNTASLGLDSPQPITGPLALFVMPSEVEQRTDARPLYDETNLWVTISNTSGGVNIGYNNPPLAAGGTTLGELVTEARRTASTGQSASQ